MKSHYSDPPRRQTQARHTLSVLVDNEPGVLARIAGLFSGRGYNIESLTVSETEHEQHVSRITIVTTGTAQVIEQIKNQLDRLVPVQRVVDLTVTGEAVERELALVRRNALARDDEELELGVRCMAAGIFDDQGKLVAGLSVSAPADRLEESWLDRVKATAAQISTALGYRGAAGSA